MGIKTKIQWADSSANPIMGCTGCVLRKDHCYAAALCARYAGRKGWPRSFDQPEFFPGRLEKAIGWKDLAETERPGNPWLNGMPRHIFVNDMSDGFCPDVDAWGWLLPYLDAMEASPHTWLLLTKWPDRMREFFASLGGAPDNFCLGTSVLRQDDEWRIEELVQIKAKVHWVSAEPLLGPVDLKSYLSSYCPHCGSADLRFVRSLLLFDSRMVCRCGWGQNASMWGKDARRGLDWIVVGGESGPRARPMDPNWARGIRDQCVTAGVPYFHKQNGEYVPADGWNQWGTSLNGEFVDPKLVRAIRTVPGDIPRHMVRVGKKAAGRRLDGQKWNQMPNGGRS